MPLRPEEQRLLNEAKREARDAMSRTGNDINASIADARLRLNSTLIRSVIPKRIKMVEYMGLAEGIIEATAADPVRQGIWKRAHDKIRARFEALPPDHDAHATGGGSASHHPHHHKPWEKAMTPKVHGRAPQRSSRDVVESLHGNHRRLFLAAFPELTPSADPPPAAAAPAADNHGH